MFVDFKRTINQKPLSQSKVPQIILDRMSEELPDGLHYASDDNGFCIVTGDNITYYDLVLTDDEIKKHKQILGDSFSYEHLPYYSYNSQQIIKLKTKKDGIININHNEIPASECFKKPLDSLDFVDGTFYIYPQPFPEPFYVTIGNDDISKEIKVHRIPDYSLDTAVFESFNDDVITIRCSVNRNTNQFHCSISLHVERAKTIEELVEAINLYYSFISGKGKLENENLLKTNVSEEVKKSVHSNYIFWHKLVEVQPILNRTFKPNIDDVDNTAIRSVEELYQGLVNHKPYYSSRNVTSVKSEFHFEKDDIDSLLGNRVVFKFNGNCSYQLLGEEFTIPCNVYVINATVEGINREGTQTEFILNNDEKSYTVIRLFLDKELQEADLNNLNDVPFDLEDVVSIKDILDSEYANL